METYSGSTFTLTAGAGVSAFSLYDSDRYIQRTVTEGVNTAMLPAAARPSGERARCYAVQGDLIIEPSSWAVSNSCRLAMRIGILEQDPLDGAYIAVPGYSIWGVGTFQDQPAQVALGSFNLWQGLFIRGFANDQPALWHVKIFARLNGGKGVTLAPNYGLAWQMEEQNGTINPRVQMRLRTLVSDDG